MSRQLATGQSARRVGVATRMWSRSKCSRDPTGQSEFFIPLSLQQTFNWLYCYRQLALAVRIVISAIAVFRLVGNILSSSLQIVHWPNYKLDSLANPARDTGTSILLVVTMGNYLGRYKGDPNGEVTVLLRWPDYWGDRITEVTLLLRWPYYWGDRITEVTVLLRWPYYWGDHITEVAVNRGSTAYVFRFLTAFSFLMGVVSIIKTEIIGV